MVNASQLFKDDEKEDLEGKPSDDQLRHITGIGEAEEQAMEDSATGGAAQDLSDQEANDGFGFHQEENDDNSDAATKSWSPGEMENAESSPANSDTVGKGFTSKGQKKGAGNFLKRHKLSILLIGGPVGGIIVFLLLLLIFANSLKIPNLAQNIETYEFARVTRQFGQSAEKTAEESLATESVNDGVWKGLKDKYSGLRDNTWGKLDRFRPSQVSKTLERKSGLAFNESKPNLLGRTTLESVSLDGKEYAISQTSGYKRFIPGFRQFDKFQNNVAFTRDFAPNLIDTMAADDVGPIIRSAVASNIRKELDIGLVSWLVARYRGKTPEAANLQVNRDAYDKIGGSEPVPSSVDRINSAEEDVKNATEKDVGDDAKLQQIINNGGVDPVAEQVLDDDVQNITNGKITTALKNINGFYAVALPLCIIYDASLSGEGAASTINNQIASQEKTFYFVASAADGQKAGTQGNDNSGDGLATAAGAMNDKLGDITDSNPYIRAAGGTPDTTATALPTEASSTGQYSLFNLLPLGGAQNAINDVVEPSCKLLTNLWVAAGIAVITQIGNIFTGGGEEATMEAATTATNQLVDQSVSAIVKRLTTQLTEKLSANLSKDALKEGVSNVAYKLRATLGIKAVKKEAPKLAGLAGLAVLAKLLVMAKAGQNNNGLEQGADFANAADAGANLHANELERMQLFGRPYTAEEICQSNAEDLSYIGQQESQKSTYERYFALSDSGSLLSRTATTLSVATSNSIPKTLTKVGNYLKSPFSFAASASNLFSNKAYAATNCDPVLTTYGNVQFGWSDAENKLIDSDDSYFPLENQAALDSELQQRGITEGKIASDYAKCFGYNFTGDSSNDGTQIFDPTDSSSVMQLDATGEGSMGSLLASGAVVRNADGSVAANEGDCSPRNLGVDNPNYGDMVFRWRLAMRYDTTLDQLLNSQTVNDSDSDGNLTTADSTAKPDSVLDDKGQPIDSLVSNSSQVLTVIAPNTSSTTATLQAWDKSGSSWVKDGPSISGHVGKDGLTESPKETLSATPLGSFTLTQAFGAKANPGTTLSYFKTDSKDWWDENPGSSTYNQHVRSSTSPGGNSEHLAAITPQYDYAVVIDANMNPTVAGNGSGFFLHVTDGGPTAGCVSIPESNLVSILKWLKPDLKPRILIGAGS